MVIMMMINIVCDGMNISKNGFSACLNDDVTTNDSAEPSSPFKCVFVSFWEIAFRSFCNCKDCSKFCETRVLLTLKKFRQI